MEELELVRPSHCERGELTAPFGIGIQAILGAIAFSTLLLKRWREPRELRRTWKIWFYDTSKQGVGAAFIHFANVFLADAVTAEDPCTWYLISFLLDSTVGLLLIYLGFKLTQKIVHHFKIRSLYFGEYGNPPKISAFLGQTILYLIVMVIEKVLVGVMVLPSFWHEVRKILLSWIKDPHIEVVLVMLIVPFCVNALMFWVVDNLLMKRSKAKNLVSLNSGSQEQLLKMSGYAKCNAQYFKLKPVDHKQTTALLLTDRQDSTDEEILLIRKCSQTTPDETSTTSSIGGEYSRSNIT
nr:store-operated calcium entry regulator STIMATE [Ciona intestinalis]|eukprot:XP_018670433.1 store-operated calcium entry regulator STIMATE [Ciona intestinalis]